VCVRGFLFKNYYSLLANYRVRKIPYSGHKKNLTIYNFLAYFVVLLCGEVASILYLVWAILSKIVFIEKVKKMYL